VTDAIEENSTGLLFEAGDVEGLAGCMVRLAKDQTLRLFLGSRARERALRDFDSKLIVAEFDGFLASAINAISH
jgi:glycosyltransferase involved in cell wall biosynthesis